MATDKYTELDKTYSPSLWPGNQQSGEEVTDQYITTMKRCYEENIRNVSHELNVDYGPQLLDLWGNLESSAKKLFVWIHGGYWQEGSKDLATSPVGPLTRHGWTVAVVGYDLATKKRLPEIFAQIIAAVNYLHKRFPHASIAMGGHSAGGHMAIKALELERRLPVDKVVSFAGVYHLEELVDTYIGRAFGLTSEEALNASVCFEKFAEGFDGRVMLVRCEFDAPKLTSQHKQFVNALKVRTASSALSALVRRGNTPCKAKVINGTNHYTLIEQLRDESSSVATVLLEFLEGKDRKSESEKNE
ncbi:ammd protein [Aphelenchoides avenae]|nr:ammd protein [Aphelenchus avenae]